MDYLAAMRAFVRAAELGSFSRAAAEEGTKVSTVSRQIAALEADLGIALFNRSTRRLHLTEAGAAFHERAARILGDVAEARQAIGSLNDRPQGLLRINIPGAFGRRHVVPHLRDFLDAYPAIQVDATLSDQTVDLIATGTDVAVRIGALADSSLVARRLAPQRRVLVASPAYLAGRPAVDQPAGLDAHECLHFTLQPKPAWYFVPHDAPGAEPMEIALRGRLRANDSEALLEAVLRGLGIALLPTWVAGEAVRSGQLSVLLPGWQATIAPGAMPAIWGVFPPKKVVSPKVRAFLAFMESRFGRPPYWDRGIQSRAASSREAAAAESSASRSRV